MLLSTKVLVMIRVRLIVRQQGKLQGLEDPLEAVLFSFQCEKAVALMAKSG